MKKKILFIISNFETGGVSKSMTSLMNVIDQEKYDVSLMVVSPKGALMGLLPSDIRLITNPIWEYLVSGPYGIIKLIKSKNLFLAIGHFIRLITSIFNKAYAGLLISKLMPPIDEYFDVIVDYNGQQQLYYMIDKLKAHKKVTFFHSDYRKWPYYYKSDKKYFPKVDYIFTISDICVNSLKDYFPEEKDKIFLMENISSLKLIESMASIRLENELIIQDIPTIITIGHLCENKGTTWALQAASILKKKRIPFHWYFLGKNLEEKYYNQLKRHLGLDDCVSFLGVRANPYPYIKSTTIVVHPSKFEGKSIALDEVKLLCKPTVVTNFSTVNDQFKNHKNASICDMNPQSIAEAIEVLLGDKSLQRKYIVELMSERHDNSCEIKKLYKIFDE